MHNGIDPSSLPVDRRYALLIGSIVPRPIAVVGTCAPDGSEPNLAPFSFFAGAGSDPMCLLFCPANRPDGTEKDSLRHAKPRAEGGSGEFTVGVATEPIIRRIVACAEELPPDQSEFDLSGLTPVGGRKVRAPRFMESPIAFECRTLQVIRTNPGKPSGGNIVIGEVVWIHADPALIDERLRVDPELLQAVGRMGGMEYTRTRDRFALPWGAAALASRNKF
ncbi:MAG: flavin reductase family protein [Planctomycetes bacterium]|nr:flavin reductase family protein [Planctomycetota bacterium]